jgi:anti-sigma factor ChrR (cupin superfamily)
LTMAHRRVTGKISEKAALHALGLLNETEAREFADHLSQGCEVCHAEVQAFQETAGMLAVAAPLRKPPSRLKRVLTERISGSSSPASQLQPWKFWGAEASEELHVVRRDEGVWTTIAGGVYAKRLYADPGRDRVTMLIRMDPGSTFPSHRHGGPEECLVLEGEIRVGDLVLRAGDYQCAPLHSVHEVTRTDTGCLLLIVSSQHDQLLA